MKMAIIEDEKGIRISLEDLFRFEGFDVVAASSWEEISERFFQETWNIILLDVMLPGADGFEIAREIREKGVHTPILMLTARDASDDVVFGLRVGADDYITKPFDPRILLARVRALLRRASTEPSRPDEAGDSPQDISFGPYHVYPRQKRVELDGKEIVLNPQEWRLLEYFLNHPDEVVDRNTLLDDVWGYESSVTTRTVDVHVGRLRKKLGDRQIQPFIHTVRGFGYRFTFCNRNVTDE